jgi:hypothetical protein
MGTEIQVSANGHGGMRPGAGRPKGRRDSGARLSGRELGERIGRLQASGRLANTSDAFLHAVGDAEFWLRLTAELERAQEWGLLVDVLKFHQQMRDGRPSQRIQLTATNISLSADDLDKVRAAVKELRPAATAPGPLDAEFVTSPPPPTHG